MTFSQKQINDALEKVRNRFFVNVGSIGLTGAAGLYFVRDNASVNQSALLFGGFFVGFFLAGTLFTLSFQREIKQSSANSEVKKSPS